MKKLVGIVFVGVLLVGLGIKLDLISMGPDNKKLIATIHAKTHSPKVEKKIQKLRTQLVAIADSIERKEQELDNAGHVQELILQKELKQLKDQEEDVTLKLVNAILGTKFHNPLQEKEKMPTKWHELIRELARMEKEVAAKEREIEKAGRAELFAVQTELNRLNAKKDIIIQALSEQLQLHLPENLIPAQNCLAQLSPEFVRNLSILFTGPFAASNNIYPVLSVDGSRVLIRLSPPDMAHVYDNMTHVYDIASRKMRLSLPNAFSPVLTADGSRLAVQLLNSNRVQVYDVASGQILLSLPNAFSPVLTADGSRLAVQLLNSNRVQVYDVASRQMLLSLPNVGYPVLTADGSRLAVQLLNPDRVQVYDVANGQMLLSVPNADYPELTADGSRLAVMLTNREVQVYDVASRQMLLSVPNAYSPVFSSDGSRLAVWLFDVWSSHVDSVQVYDVASGQMLLSLPNAGYPVLTANGSRLAVMLTNREVQVYDVASRQMLLSLPNAGYPVLTANGSRLAVRLLNPDRVQVYDLKWLNALSITQCELLRAFDMLIQDTQKAIKNRKPRPGRIQATQAQWSTFESFPESVQEKLRNYITEPESLPIDYGFSTESEEE